MTAIDTGDLAADLFAAALRATEAMVFDAARKSMPASRFLPKFELTAWDDEKLREVAGLFDKAVRAVVTEERGLKKSTERRAA